MLCKVHPGRTLLFSAVLLKKKNKTIKNEREIIYTDLGYVSCSMKKFRVHSTAAKSVYLLIKVDKMYGNGEGSHLLKKSMRYGPLTRFSQPTRFQNFAPAYEV